MLWALLLRLAPLLMMLAAAAVIDIKERRIPNWLTFGLMSAGLARAFCIAGLPGVTHSILGLLTGAGLAVALYAISALGGGDVKLLAGIGAWLGPLPTLMIFLVEAIVGLLIVLIQATYQGRLRTVLRNSTLIAASFACVSEAGIDQAIETGKACRSVARPLPYAVPVYIATLLVLTMGIMAGR
jgi:prepilin peptidase CpaA